MMFGKPEWFQERQVGWGLRPVAWQGWAYSASWIAVIAVPFLGLLIQGLVAESLIWMTVATAAIVWDVHSILREIKPREDDDVLYIGDDEALSEQFASRNFNFRLRR